MRLLCRRSLPFSLFFFFNDTATTEIYTLSLHDALPIFPMSRSSANSAGVQYRSIGRCSGDGPRDCTSEEHTSELPSHFNLAFRLFLEKKKNTTCDETHGFPDPPTRPFSHPPRRLPCAIH